MNSTLTRLSALAGAGALAALPPSARAEAPKPRPGRLKQAVCRGVFKDAKLELLNSKVDHPGYMCDHTAWGVRLCKAVDSPRFKLLYDIYHPWV